MNFKVVINDPKSRRSFQKEVEQGASGLLGRKIGERVKGDFIGLHGYELEITGGSDKDGFPMRRDIPGTIRKKALLSGGPGFKPKKRGERRRKTVRGNTIDEDIVQVNMKVVSYGTKSIEEMLGIEKGEVKKEGEKQAEKAEEMERKEGKRPEKGGEEEKKQPEREEGKSEEGKQTEEAPEGKESDERKGESEETHEGKGSGERKGGEGEGGEKKGSEEESKGEGRKRREEEGEKKEGEESRGEAKEEREKEKKV